MISTSERTWLRELAQRVADVAALPVQEQRRRLWKRHHALDPDVRPMILVFPEGSWRELLPEDLLRCSDPWARRAERVLREKLYTHEHLDADHVVEPTFDVIRHVGQTGWGLETLRHASNTPTGAFAFAPTMHTLADAKKLRHPEVTLDEAASARDLQVARDVLGDILTVRQTGITYLCCHLTNLFTGWRGLDQFCLDLVDEPQWVHDTMAFITEGLVGLRRQWEALGLLGLNNTDQYQSSGGLGYTDQLPAAGFDPEHVRCRDLWGSAESQEMTMISPDMHRDFIMAYEARFIEPFGLNGYGCCDDLTHKLDDVCALPNMRRISISPFADVVRCAEQLGGRAILSWKPHPSDLVGAFDPGIVRARIRTALEAAAAHGCVFEMILKDTHTCEHEPGRFTAWTRVAREEVARICEHGVPSGRWEHDALPPSGLPRDPGPIGEAS